MEDFSTNKKTSLLKAGDKVYPGDTILAMEQIGDEVFFEQYEVEVEDPISPHARRTFFLISRAELKEPRKFGAVVRNNSGTYLFDGREWRNYLGYPVSWAFISGKGPVTIIKKGVDDLN